MARCGRQVEEGGGGGGGGEAEQGWMRRWMGGCWVDEGKVLR